MDVLKGSLIFLICVLLSCANDFLSNNAALKFLVSRLFVSRLNCRRINYLHVHILVDLVALLKEAALHRALSQLLRGRLHTHVESKYVRGLDPHCSLFNNWPLCLDVYDFFLPRCSINLELKKSSDELKRS